MGFFRNLGYRLRTGLQKFMRGRYGTDKLNTAILVVALITCIVTMFVNNGTAQLLLMVLYYALVFVVIFRTLSRNTYKRYQENRKFLLFFQRLKDRQHRYYDCPRCRQQVRVPRGKGKISITCPKCTDKFIKKT